MGNTLVHDEPAPSVSTGWYEAALHSGKRREWRLVAINSQARQGLQMPGVLLKEISISGCDRRDVVALASEIEFALPNRVPSTERIGEMLDWLAQAGFEFGFRVN